MQPPADVGPCLDVEGFDYEQLYAAYERLHGQVARLQAMTAEARVGRAKAEGALASALKRIGISSVLKCKRCKGSGVDPDTCKGCRTSRAYSDGLCKACYKQKLDRERRANRLHGQLSVARNAIAFRMAEEGVPRSQIAKVLGLSIKSIGNHIREGRLLQDKVVRAAEAKQ